MVLVTIWTLYWNLRRESREFNPLEIEIDQPKLTYTFLAGWTDLHAKKVNKYKSDFTFIVVY